MNIVLVYNSRSGSALPLGELTRKMSAHNITIDHAIDITENFKQAIAPHIQSGAYIAAIGGDGTLSSVAQEVYGTKATMIPLPGGTLNHFTKDLNIPQDLDEAIATLHSKDPRKVDVATINETVFINNSSIGLYPSTVHEREQIESKYGKWPSAVYASIKAFIRFKHYVVTIDGIEYRTPFVFVGNNNYDITNAAQRSSLDEGVLCVHMITSDSRLSLLKIIAYAIVGSIRDSEDLTSLTTRSVTIHAKKTHLRVSRDGEVAREPSPLRYKSQPASLRILG
ncbi:MAG: Sphingosine/diacylglycerol kinase-like protein enzyme [Candidatus Saccharibacteria bacterium GW2011_GWC2_48_9]|nr:MAG: Sphingosine/diacylglycerol kinase-like protein enzyme [Candidatus Saccharibacteria bacterium GW2011_GWC2_48_9]